MLNLSQPLIRGLFVALLFSATFILPWWWVAALGVIGILSFYWFIELVGIGLYLDVVFSSFWMPFIALGALILLLVIELVTYYISYK
jgi:hypothetical protein